MSDFIESIERDKPVVRAVGVKGKMLYFIFSNGKAIISTFGLSGNWVKSKGNHCDMALKFDSITLWFQDQLHYGNIKFTDAVYLKKRLSQLGPDTAHGARDITKDVWSHICKRNQKSTVTQLLMSQNKISGIGNYLKAEILYEAGIAPTSTVDDLPSKKLDALYAAVTTIPQAWLKYRIRKGPRQIMKVYGKKKDPEGNNVKRDKTADGRVTHWVLNRQVEYTAY